MRTKTAAQCLATQGDISCAACSYLRRRVITARSDRSRMLFWHCQGGEEFARFMAGYARICLVRRRRCKKICMLVSARMVTLNISRFAVGLMRTCRLCGKKGFTAPALPSSKY